jgi:hypothetical protein
MSDYALGQIQLLYKIEQKAAEDNLSAEETALLRKKLAEPILDAFEGWMEANYKKVLPQGKMGEAIKYTYALLPRLRQYITDGTLLIDNNAAYPNLFVIPTLFSKRRYRACC